MIIDITNDLVETNDKKISFKKVADITKEQFDRLAVAINTGTNLPSVATPNGQAAFLFLLTSSKIRKISFMNPIYLLVKFKH